MRKIEPEFDMYNGKTDQKGMDRVETRKFLKRDYLECMVKVLWDYWDAYAEKFYTY